MKSREIRIKLSQEAYEKVERQAVLHDTKVATMSAMLLMERVNAMEAQSANTAVAGMFQAMAPMFEAMIEKSQVEDSE